MAGDKDFVSTHLSAGFKEAAKKKWGEPPYDFEFRGLYKFECWGCLTHPVMIGMHRNGEICAVDLELWENNPEWGNKAFVEDRGGARNALREALAKIVLTRLQELDEATAHEQCSDTALMLLAAEVLNKQEMDAYGSFCGYIPGGEA